TSSDGRARPPGLPGLRVRRHGRGSDPGAPSSSLLALRKVRKRSLSGALRVNDAFESYCRSESWVGLNRLTSSGSMQRLSRYGFPRKGPIPTAGAPPRRRGESRCVLTLERMHPLPPGNCPGQFPDLPFGSVLSRRGSARRFLFAFAGREGGWMEL